MLLQQDWIQCTTPVFKELSVTLFFFKSHAGLSIRKLVGGAPVKVGGDLAILNNNNSEVLLGANIHRPDAPFV